MSRVCTLIPLLAAGCGAAAEPADHAAGHPHAHGGAHVAQHHDFSDVDRFARIFDDPTRDEWQRPADVVQLLELREGMTVVDLGAGTGYFLARLSSAVGRPGRVLALDVEPAMVAHMERRAGEAGLTNVEARAVEPDDPGLAPASVDRILIVDTWHHVEARERYAARLFDALRPGGFVLVIDFTEESPHGPPPELRVRAAVAARELRSAGLDATLVTERLPYQYAVRAMRPDGPR
jgi:SAM-dependent methyltransferase